MGVGAGDRLARGAVRANFGPVGTKISQQDWDSMFEGFNREEFEKKEAEKGDGKFEAKTLGLTPSGR